MNNKKEKRGISRADYSVVCRIVSQNMSAACHIRNFSLTGLLIDTDRSDLPEIGERVTIILKYFCPEIKHSEIDCEVVRILEGSMGLKFVAIDYDTLMELKTILYEVIGDYEKIDIEILKHIEEK